MMQPASSHYSLVADDRTLTTSPALRQILNQQNLQDDRLSQCADQGWQWENCFFYGTGTVRTSSDGRFRFEYNNNNNKNSARSTGSSRQDAPFAMRQSSSTSSGYNRPPTW